MSRRGSYRPTIQQTYSFMHTAHNVLISQFIKLSQLSRASTSSSNSGMLKLMLAKAKHTIITNSSLLRLKMHTLQKNIVSIIVDESSLALAQSDSQSINQSISRLVNQSTLPCLLFNMASRCHLALILQNPLLKHSSIYARNSLQYGGINGGNS